MGKDHENLQMNIQEHGKARSKVNLEETAKLQNYGHSDLTE